MEFYLVDIKDITSDVPRSQFNPSDIESLADAILETIGLIRPLILKQLLIDKYTVVEGHLEYYAAVRAKEKNPRQAEMVNALVVPAQMEDAVKKQAQLFTNNSGAMTSTPSDRSQGDDRLHTNDAKITNIELRVEQRFNEIQSSLVEQVRQINDRMKELENKIPKPENPLNLINSLTESELAIKLQRTRINGAEKLAKNIVTARNKQPQKQFPDYRSIVDTVKGLGDKTLLTIIDAWSRG